MSVCGLGDDIDTLDSEKIKLFKHSAIYINLPTNETSAPPNDCRLSDSESESVTSNEINFKKIDESIITTDGLLTYNETCISKLRSK